MYQKKYIKGLFDRVLTKKTALVVVRWGSSGGPRVREDLAVVQGLQTIEPL